MPVLREQDFDKLATRVVDQFLSGKAKLAEAAAQEAMESGLNPDQIERLTQAANTMTFLRMMDQRKQEGAGDLMHEFDPIDSRQVIRIVIDNTGVHVDGPHQEGASPEENGNEGELPDEMSALRQPQESPPVPPPALSDSPGQPEQPDEGAEDDDSIFNDGHSDDEGNGKAPPFVKKEKKPAKDEKPDKAEKKEEKKESPKEAALRIMRMRKLAGILDNEYHQAEWAFEDTLTKLAARFKRVYNDVTFEEFEKDALAEYGDATGVTVLNLLRQERKLPVHDVKVAFKKVAALTDRHVSRDTPELYLFETLVKTAETAQKLQRGLEWIKAQCA